LGGAVLKAVNGKFEVVGLHRRKINSDYHCGTKIKNILEYTPGKGYNAGM